MEKEMNCLKVPPLHLTNSQLLLPPFYSEYFERRKTEPQKEGGKNIVQGSKRDT